MERRDFLKKTSLSLAATTVSINSLLAGERRPISPPPLKLKKSLKFDMVKENLSLLDKFKLLKELGFDGVELETPNTLPMKEVLQARDKTGLEIPGVVCGATWKAQLSHRDPAIRENGVNLVKQSLNDCKQYGGTTVLVIPGVVSEETSYQDAYARSQEEIKKLFPEVEKTGIKIAFENVWNNFLLSPLECARFVDEINHPMIAWYFDVGNVVRYGWPEHWIEVLDKRILKLDVKEYSRKKHFEEGAWKGFDVELLEGDCNWPAVNAALRKIGYSGWASAEVPGGDRTRLLTISQKMDEISRV
ncbi:MAG: sugar phosphate isomerase/epimerase family protein [Cyclobacteriaceae bacterium]